MHKIIFLLGLIAFIPYGSAEIVKTMKLERQKWNFGFVDHKKNLIIITQPDPLKKEAAEILHVNNKGEIVKRRQMESYPYEIAYVAYGLKNGDVFTVVHDKGNKFRENVYHFQASTGPKFEAQIEGVGDLVDLGSEEVAMNCLKCPWLYLFSLKGTLKKKVKLGYNFIIGTPSNDLVVTTPTTVQIMDRTFKTKHFYTEENLKFIFGMTHLTKNGSLILGNENKELLFLDKNMKLKARFKASGLFHGITDLPDGNIAAINQDGYLYFFDTNGNLRTKHFHNSTKASNVEVCGNKVVYWNTTELVYVDFNGKELGTFKMPSEQIKGLVFPMNDNHLVAYETTTHTLHFTKCL